MNEKNIGRRRLIFIVILFILIVVVIQLGRHDLRQFIERCSWLYHLGRNILFLIDVITHLRLIIFLTIMILIWNFIKKRWVIRFEKLDVGGASIIFEQPENLFNQQIKNFMNTKRTLFYFDPNRDNISDTIKSYYQTYEFIRENIKLFDIKSSTGSEYYEEANKMIYKLNEFLTSYQSNYRRWYDHRVSNPRKTDYQKCISEIQKDYWNYQELIVGFAEFNNDFLNYAKTFGINTEKWDNPQKNKNGE